VANPRANAHAVLVDLGISAAADLASLEDIAWERGALVRDAPIGGAEARLAVVGRRAVITVSATLNHARRRRFAIAHELGHFEMHKGESGLSICVSDDIERPALGRQRDEAVGRESEANEFASHLLIPDRFSADLVKGVAPTLDLVRGLSDRFDVSLTAAGIAYMRVCSEACAVVYSQNGYVKWFQRSKDLEDYGLWISLGPIDQYTIASSFFRNRPMQAIPGRVDAVSWFAPGRFSSDGTIKEHSIAMPNYNAVLSLLWVDQDIFG
jgi:hypothetical protein